MQEVRGSSPLISTNNLGHLGGLFFFMGKLTAGFTAGFYQIAVFRRLYLLTFRAASPAKRPQF